jgi:histidyl-tRNA synthetase
VLAGGRYDGLVSTLGGPETPAAGWALGIERLALLLEEARGGASAKASHGFYIVSDDTLAAAQLANDLRNAGVVVEYDYDNTKVGKQIEKAAKRNARYVIFYLADERSSGSYKIKDLSDASECSVGSIAGILELVGSKPVTARAL